MALWQICLDFTLQLKCDSELSMYSHHWDCILLISKIFCLPLYKSLSSWHNIWSINYVWAMKMRCLAKNLDFPLISLPGDIAFLDLMIQLSDWLNCRFHHIVSFCQTSAQGNSIWSISCLRKPQWKVVPTNYSFPYFTTLI